MKNLLIQLLIAAYAGVGVVAAIGYWPTIKDLFHKKPSANINSYLIWTATATISFLYSLFILPDILFRMVAGVNFVCCALILGLSLNIKYSTESKKKNHK